MYNLVISDDEGMTTVVPLVRDEITVGRLEGNTIRLTERNISRHHARLKRAFGAFSIIDLNSYNGVRVNGMRIKGEAKVKEGDKIQVGDYLLAIQSMAAVRAARAPTARMENLSQTMKMEEPIVRPPSAQTAPIPSAPRFYVLNSDERGTEYVLAGDEVRIGRAEDLEVCINHPSISREHAVVASVDGGYSVRDLGSANGMRVNGEDVKEQVIHPGDLVELGQVKLRFVAPGAVFDVEEDSEAVLLVGPFRGYGKPLAIALAAICIAAAGTAIYALRTGVVEVPAPVAEEPREVEKPTVLADKTFKEALQKCRDALQSMDYEEALSYGSAAAKLRPQDQEASGCKAEAQAAYDEEQAFAQAKGSLEQGDIEDAYQSVKALPADSVHRTQPEISEISKKYAESILGKARTRVRADPASALTLTEELLGMQPIPTGVEDEAKRIQATAERLRVRQLARAEQRGGARPARPTRNAPTAPPSAANSNTPFESARDCLARGDQRCAITALEGNTRLPRELALLIETYRSVGETGRARTKMEEFLRRFPRASQAEYYEQFLERQP